MGTPDYTIACIRERAFVPLAKKYRDIIRFMILYEDPLRSYKLSYLVYSNYILYPLGLNTLNLYNLP
jgi:hypothetical protein